MSGGTPAGGTGDGGGQDTHGRTRLGEAVLVAVVLATFVGAAVSVAGFPAGNRLLPAMIVGPGIALGVYVGFRLAFPGVGKAYQAVDEAGALASSDLVRLLWGAAFFLAVVMGGFRWGAPVMALLYAWRAGERPPVAALIGALSLVVIILFERLFSLRFPLGVIERML